MSVVEKLEDKKYTLEEYLALEELAEYKSEFLDGTIVAMAGGKPNHNKIANSIGRTCTIALKDVYRRVNNLGNKDSTTAS